MTVPIQEVDKQRAIANLNALVQQIDAYNSRFTLGGLLLGTLSRAVAEFEGAPLPSIPDEQKADAELLARTNWRELNQIGLAVEQVTSKAVHAFGPSGEEFGDAEIRLNVIDNGKFQAFLARLEPEDVIEREFGLSLAKISGILTKQLTDHYNLCVPSDAALELLGSLGGIVEQFERLSLGESVARLKKYLSHAQAGNLREQLLIEGAGLLSQPGENFGPADWHNDATEEYYSRRWNLAVHILEIVGENPKAKELFDQVADHLMMCSGKVLGFLEANPDFRPQWRDSYRDTLQRSQASIRKLQGGSNAA